MDWSTAFDDQGQPLVLMKMFASPQFGLDGAYLALAAAEMKKEGFEPEGFLIPITHAGQRTLIPLLLKEPKDNFRAVIYSNAAPWSRFEVECLQNWLTLIRASGIVHESIPAIVVAQYDSEPVKKVDGVGKFVVKRLLDREPPEKRPPAAEYAAKIVAEVAPLLGENKQIDFSPNSLVVIDALLDRMRETTKVDVSKALLILGVYVGEVFIRNIGGKWMNREESGMAELATGPLVVSLASGTFLNPLGKVLKRFDQGNGESLAYYYQAVVKQEMEGK